MSGEPEIVKQLREEKRLGILAGMSQGSYEELETPGAVLEDMPDESITIMEDAEKDDFYEEPIQDGDLPSNESIDVKELTTTVLAVDGQSISIGGLFKDNDFTDHFFKTRSSSNLNIILTPHIQ